MSDHPLTFTTNFLSSHTHPEPKLYQKSLIPTRVAWRLIITARQFILKFQKLVKSPCVAWRSGMYRQAVPSQEPKIGILCMRRLTAMNSPPGGFWKISRTQRLQSNNTDSAKHTYSQSYNYEINNIRRGSAPLTWFSFA